MSTLNIVILAAGKGKRMHSDKPKVLHALAGRPLLQHVLETATQLAPGKNTCVVYGHGGEAVPLALAQYGTGFVLQEPQLGTGHAVQQALPHLQDGSLTLVLYGDVPLIQRATLEKMFAQPDALTLLTLHLSNPSGYGRIVRDVANNVSRIVEEKDATAEQRAIREVNTGILAVPTRLLRDWLAKLKNDNAQDEYYLTDIVAMAVAQAVAVHTVHPAHEWEVMGINSKVQLAELERIWQQEIAHQLLIQGVTLAEPARLDVRGKLSCGNDVEIDVGCVFEGDVTLGNKVKVGATASSKMPASARARTSHPTVTLIAAKWGLTATSVLTRDCAPAASYTTVCTSAISSKSRTVKSPPTARPTTSAISATAVSAAASTSAPVPSPATTMARTNIAP